jgi:nucleoid-associated protein YgaU
VLSRLAQRFILFHADGKPARARLQASFSEYSDASVEPKEVKRETADYAKLHVAGHGETLSAVAAQVYDNPALWRPIAIANGIADPRRLEPGQRLHIPALPFRDPETGEVTG